MNILDVSKLGNRWKGHFDTTASYKKGDVVRVGDKTQVFTDDTGTKTDFAVGQIQFTEKGQIAANQTSFPVGRDGQEFMSRGDGSGGFISEFRHNNERNGTRVVSLQDHTSARDNCEYVNNYVPTYRMTDGSLRAFGNVSQNAAGTQDVNSQNRKDSLTIPLPHGVKAKKHWVGLAHIFVLGEDNILYGGGFQWSGQFSGSTATVAQQIRQISHREGDAIQEEIKEMALSGYNWNGYQCFMALGVSGKVYVWGRQAFNSFGIASASSQGTPQLIPWTADRPIKKCYIHAGYYSTSYLIDTEDVLLTAGANSRNLHPFETKAYVPGDNTTGHQVFNPWGSDSVKIAHIACHDSDGHWASGTQYYTHIAVTLEDGRCYVIGNGNNQLGWNALPNGWSYGWRINPNLPFHTNVKKLMTKNGGYASAVALMKDGTIQHNGYSPGSATNANTAANYWQEHNSNTTGYLGPDLNNVQDLQGLGSRYGETWAVRQADGKMYIWGRGNGGTYGTGTAEGTQNGGTTSGTVNGTTGAHTYALCPANITDFVLHGYCYDATGYGYISALDDKGQAWGWGYGGNTTAQDDDNEDQRTPNRIRF